MATAHYPPAFPDDVIPVAFERLKSRIFGAGLVPSKFHPSRSAFEPSPRDSSACIKEIIILEAAEIAEDVSLETHTITVDGEIYIHAASPFAVLRAFETIRQLFYTHSSDPNKVYSPYAPTTIKDSPVYEHRGLHLDISRNYIPPSDVTRTIEGMSMNKLNKLHLHATDSQSWPIEIPALPELASKGSYHDEQIWTVKDLENVQRHGLYHGIEVFLEIDMPGHTASIYHAYPDLVVGYDLKPWEKWALEPPSGQLCLNSDAVYKFVDTLFKDILPRVSPHSSRFHLGGDEINCEVYELEQAIGSSSREVLRPLLQEFFDFATQHVEKADLVPHVWHEMLLDWDLQLPDNTIVQAWKPGCLEKIVAKGFRAIFGAYTEWYLDGGFGTFFDPVDPSNGPLKYPYLDYNSPYKNFRQMLSYDPLKDIPEEQRHLVTGGEMCMWCELTDSTSLDFMLWPRVAAGAEVLWSGKGEVCEGTTRQLAEMRERLVNCGIKASVVQMEWGLRNRGGCTL